uniref:Uncharacterized protein n=1 Tax=Romanomermis culicivorax TaxID=13658 RepID=A0A915KQL4_ROMCU
MCAATNGPCCHTICGHLCGDCTKATPYCGLDKCDMTGCYCEGGCRIGNCSNVIACQEHMEQNERGKHVTSCLYGAVMY